MQDKMNNSIDSLFTKRQRRRHFIMVLFCISLCVAAVVYGMMKIPAVSRESHNPLITTESANALNDEKIALRVFATAESGDPETVFLLSMQKNGAGLSDEYVFDEYGETELTAESGNVITLHMTKNTVDSAEYWFSLPMNTSEKLNIDCAAISTDGSEASGEMGTERPDPASSDEAADADITATGIRSSSLELSSASGNTLEAAQEALNDEEAAQYSWFFVDEAVTAQPQESADQATAETDAESTALPDEVPMTDGDPPEEAASNVLLRGNASLTVADIEALIDALPEPDTLEQMESAEIVDVQYEVGIVSDAISDLSEEDYESIDEARLLKFLELSDHFSGGVSQLDQTGTVGNIAWSYNELTDTLTLTGSGSVPANFLVLLPGDQPCNSPSKLIIGGGITGIANEAFFSKTCLTQVTIGSGVASIGVSAFSQCSMLTSLTLPQDGSLRSIGTSAFSYCSSLTALSLPASIEEWGDWTFSQCYALSSLTFANGLKTIGPRAFYESRSLVAVTMPSSMKTIGYASFSHCAALQSVTLNEGLEQVFLEAFLNSGLQGVITIPASVKKIGYKAFAVADPSLADISITQPTQLTELGYQFTPRFDFNGWNYYPMLKSFVLNSLVSDGDIQITEHADYNGHQDPVGYDDVEHSDNVVSTWLTKSAKWTDDELTTAELRIDFSANNRMTDYIFVIDHTGSMASPPVNGNQTAKIYMLARLMTKVNDALLNTSGYDNRVAVITFSDSYPFVVTHGFTNDSNTANGYLTSDIVYGQTDYAKPLQATLDLINSRSGNDASRPVKVIFLSDGAPNSGDRADGIYGKNQADALKAIGIPIYGILFDTPTNESMSYICDIVYSASDDVGLNAAFNEAINNTIGVSSKLVDVIEDENFTIPEGAVITVTDSGGNLIPDAAVWHTDENGKQIIEWNVSELRPCINYTLILRSLQLNKNSSGDYLIGDLPTNDDDDTKKATIEDVGGGKVNDVSTPVLSRDGYRLPATGGHGLLGIYICGFLLLSGSLIILIKQWRRKQGGDRSC